VTLPDQSVGYTQQTPPPPLYSTSSPPVNSPCFLTPNFMRAIEPVLMFFVWHSFPSPTCQPLSRMAVPLPVFVGFNFGTPFFFQFFFLIKPFPLRPCLPQGPPFRILFSFPTSAPPPPPHWTATPPVVFLPSLPHASFLSGLVDIEFGYRFFGFPSPKTPIIFALKVFFCETPFRFPHSVSRHKG